MHARITNRSTTVSTDMKHNNQSGSMIFAILIAVVALAALSFVIFKGEGESGSISKEKLIISATSIEKHGSELSQAVKILIESGLSESDVSFAHANAPSTYGDPSSVPSGNQIFTFSGGQARYITPNADISSASFWEFFGESAMPQVGSSRADLIAVLPNVTKEFCDVFNQRQDLDIDSTYPEDTGACFKADDGDRFAGTFNTSPNTLDTTTFSAMPALRACVQCGSDYHVYMTIYTR